MALNLDSLPDPEIVETISFQTIFDQLRGDFQSRFPAYTALVESDPAIKLLEVAAYREVILRARVNDAFKATLLAFAAAGDLDNLAAFYGLTRLASEDDAELRERTINRIQGSSTAGGAAWYRYQALTANNGVRDARVTSPDAGQVQIALLSKETQNLVALGRATSSLSSAMRTLAEFYMVDLTVPDAPANDAAVADAIQAKIDAAGPRGQATPYLISAVNTFCQGDRVRVITDNLSVISANVTSVDVTADVYLYPDSDTSILNGIEQTVRAAIEEQGGLGWDLTLSWLIKHIHVDGVQRVELTSPTTNQVADAATAISIGTFTINNRGYDR